MSYSDVHVWTSALQTLNGATDLELPFVAMSRLVITKVGLRLSSADAGGASVVFERRRSASTDTTIETVVVPAADHDGDLVYVEIDPADQIEFLPGDCLNLAVTEAGTAPTAYAVVEYFLVDTNMEKEESDYVVESA